MQVSTVLCGRRPAGHRTGSRAGHASGHATAHAAGHTAGQAIGRQAGQRSHRQSGRHRQRDARLGTSLCEVLLALTLLSATAAWGLQAAAAAEKSLGKSHHRRDALHRAERALNDLNALPCDSINITRVINEPRWRITATRDHDGLSYADDITLRTTLGDTVQLHRGGWCD